MPPFSRLKLHNLAGCIIKWKQLAVHFLLPLCGSCFFQPLLLGWERRAESKVMGEWPARPLLGKCSMRTDSNMSIDVFRRSANDLRSTVSLLLYPPSSKQSPGGYLPPSLTASSQVGSKVLLLSPGGSWEKPVMSGGAGESPQAPDSKLRTAEMGEWDV